MDFDNIFDGIKENKKTLIIVLILFVVLIVISIFNLISDNDSTLDNEEIIKTFAGLYYEDGYYPEVTSIYRENYANKLKEYEAEGIKLTLLDIISTFEDIDEYKFYKEGNYCDFEKTYAIIYPKAPYGVNDYTIKTKISCTKKIKEWNYEKKENIINNFVWVIYSII